MTDDFELKENEIIVAYHNASYIQVVASDSILREINEFFSFEVPGAKFSPAYKAKKWSGIKYLFSLMTQQLPAGLFASLKTDFALPRKYTIKEYDTISSNSSISPDTLASFLNELNVHSRESKIEYHPHQKEAIYYCINDPRVTVSSPTSSGKSLIIYSLIRWHLNNNVAKILLIVPTVSLVLQMFSDFEDYSSANEWSTEKHCHKIYSGQEKDSPKPVIISTWQSMQTKPAGYFQQFDAVIGDECVSGETLIKTPYGEKFIKDISIGDSVWSYNIKTEKFEIDEVIFVYENSNMSKNDKMFEIILENGEKIKITGNHKVLTENGYRRVDELAVGDEILDCINRIQETEDHYATANSIKEDKNARSS